MSSWQPSGQNPQPYQTPAASFYGPPPPKQGPSTGLWIGLAIGGVLLLLCGGSGCVGIFLFGINLVEAEIVALLRDNPKLREHIGEIQSLEFDFIATQAEDGDLFVYNVKGDKGSGKLTIREGTNADSDRTVEEATLRLPDGTKVKIVP